MAVPHFSVTIVARGSGRSAVLSAAYRHCAKMTFVREARCIDYTRKQGLLHEDFAIPADAPKWLRSMVADRSIAAASEAFWNKVEEFEKRSDAQLAKDVTIALPLELTAGQNIALVQDFVSEQITSKGMVADWVYHDNPGNPHVHLMTTLRPLTEDGFGHKKTAVLAPDGKPLRDDAGKIVYRLWAGGGDDFNALRDGWFACQNRHLARAGLDVQVDGRAFEKQGIAMVPTIHLGVANKAVERKLQQPPPAVVRGLDRTREQARRRAENRRRILTNPGIVLGAVTREKSVFSELDVAKILHRNVDDAGTFQTLMARIMQDPSVLRLEREHMDFNSGLRVPARYTTRELILLEAEMCARAVWLDQHSTNAVHRRVLDRVFNAHPMLSDEQKTAIMHAVGPQRIAAIIGRAGAGKTTMMKAARQAWQAAGYQIVGGALAGKAAEGLEKEAGIPSRTLASWQLRWEKGQDQLDAKTVFVLDEAGMVSSRQMAAFLEAATRNGAKLVLVGDPEQLQPIDAGAAFRAIAERIGYAELETIYRQREQWMRDASLELARGNVGKAVESYRTHGRFKASPVKSEGIRCLIADWSRDFDPSKSMLILAHLRRDVATLNECARQKLVDRGLIGPGSTFITENGPRQFAPGDQIVFLRNDTSLGVKNGALAKVVEAVPGRLTARLWDDNGGRLVTVSQSSYSHLDHGYATTIHKAQGATVDKVKVLASLSLDRHLTYVAMTRHREDLTVYYGSLSFARAGGLVPLLSRSQHKETTLDYDNGGFYRAALRFAEARGLHLMAAARSILSQRLAWVVQQKQQLLDLAGRLLVAASKGDFAQAAPALSSASSTPARPAVSATRVFAQSIDQVVEDKIAADATLKTAWKEVVTRFHHVYAQPQTAFKAIDIQSLLKDPALARLTLDRLAAAPETFGKINGRIGILASRADKASRTRAMSNVGALVSSIDDYLRQRLTAQARYGSDEWDVRRRLGTSIPALSRKAESVLQQVKDAIDRDGPNEAVALARLHQDVSEELDCFAAAVSFRFGRHVFLAINAQDVEGAAFKKLTIGLDPQQKDEVRAALPDMRVVQQVLNHEQTAMALKQAQALRLPPQGLRLQ